MLYFAMGNGIYHPLNPRAIISIKERTGGINVDPYLPPVHFLPLQHVHGLPGNGSRLVLHVAISVRRERASQASECAVFTHLRTQAHMHARTHATRSKSFY